MLKDTLNQIREDLSQTSSKSKNALLATYIQERLDSCLLSYQHDIDIAASYLERRKPFNVAKRLNKR